MLLCSNFFVNFHHIAFVLVQEAVWGNCEQSVNFDWGNSGFGTFGRQGSDILSLSRKLASASWSPSCFSKVLGGLESPIAWNFTVNYPSPRLVHKQFGRGSIAPGDTVGMSPPEATSAASASSASLASSIGHGLIHYSTIFGGWFFIMCNALCVFMPAELAFVPYPWASTWNAFDC